MSTIDAPARPVRYLEIDSLRGLAALAVVLYHFHMMWKTDAPSVSPSPFLRSLSSLAAPVGLEAVILFFVLSGFVLSLPAVSGKPQRYLTFVVRRVFRIYVPYLAALAVSVAGAFWLHGPVTHSGWFNKSWSEPVNWHLVGQHLLFLGVYDRSQFENPIWSLIHEMRISLVFPFLCAAVLRLRNRWGLVSALGLTVAAILLERKPFLVDSFQADSAHYAAFFILGILVARNRDILSLHFSQAHC